MRKLRLLSLHLCSDLEKAARFETFEQKTVILGDNDTGKSCLIKSIYAAFGADAAKVNDRWTQAKVNLLATFAVDGLQYRVLRNGSFFALFDANDALMWSGSGIVSGIGPQIAKLLNFNLTLANKKGEQTVPPPAFSFLPFYVDQDVGWGKTWSSFAGLQMFDKYKRDVAYFHSGLRPNAFYEAKGEKQSADRAKEELKVDRRALERADARLKSKRSNLKVDLSPDQFGDRIDALLQECDAVQRKQDIIQKRLSALQSTRAILIEQKEIAENALAELELDYQYLRKTSEPEITCPTCGTVHENDFANKFGLISDADSCRGFVLDATKELQEIQVQIDQQRSLFNEFNHEAARINEILNAERGEVKLRDLIESESERLIDDAIATERSDLDQKIGEQDGLADEAAATMKSFDDRKHQKPIKDAYFGFMKQFLHQLNIPSLPEKSFKSIDCTINETGSDLSRALLAYYYAFAHTMHFAGTSAFCPLVIDTPVQQDQDPTNAAKMIDFVINKAPSDAQIILGTVGLHGVKYEGHTISTTRKEHLLDGENYEAVSAFVKPFMDKLLNASAN